MAGRGGGYDDDLEDYDDEQPKSRTGQREVMDIIPERYDNDSDSRTAKKSAHTRLILTVALVLLAIAALGVAARQIFVPDSGAPMPVASIPTITPDQNPIRAKPDNPGGMDVPNQDKLIYDRMASGTNAPVRETLLPAAEQPATPPAQPRPPATIKPAFDAPQPQSGQAPGQVAGQNVPPAPTPAPREAVLPDPTPPAPIATPIVPPTPQPIVTLPAPPAPIVPPTPQAQPTPIVPPTPITPPTPAKPTVGAGGGWVAQLAALKTEAAAQNEWTRIARANSDLLGGYSSDILRVDLGAKGIFWRLRAGPMDEVRARTVCAELKKRGQGCIVGRK